MPNKAVSPEERARSAVRELLDQGEKLTQRRVQELAHCRAKVALDAIQEAAQTVLPESTAEPVATRVEVVSPDVSMEQPADAAESAPKAATTPEEAEDSAGSTVPSIPKPELARLRQRYGDEPVDQALELLAHQNPGSVQNPVAWVSSVVRRRAEQLEKHSANAAPNTTPGESQETSTRQGTGLFVDPRTRARRIAEGLQRQGKPITAEAVARAASCTLEVARQVVSEIVAEDTETRAADPHPAPTLATQTAVGGTRGGVARTIVCVLTAAAAKAVAEVLHDPPPQTVIVGPGEGGREIDRLLNVPCDALLVDIGTGPMLGYSLIRYRVARPNTRIVLLASGREPGDWEVSEVVATGVYDVVTDPAALPRVLDSPPSGISAAAGWLELRLQHPERRTQVQGWREKVVERRVPMRQHPALIAVSGVGRRVGSTTLSCAVATYAARLGYDCALAEIGDSTVVPGQPNFEMVSDHVPGDTWLPHVCLWADGQPSLIRDLMRVRRAPYVFGDLGCVPAEDVAALEADLTILVLPPSMRYWKDMVRWLFAHSRSLPALRSDAALSLEEKRRLWSEREAAEEADRKALAGLERLLPNLCAAVLAWEPDWREVAATWNALWSFGRPPMPVFGIRLGEGWPPGYGRPSANQNRDLNTLLEPLLPDAPPRHEEGPRKGLLSGWIGRLRPGVPVGDQGGSEDEVPV